MAACVWINRCVVYVDDKYNNNNGEEWYQRQQSGSAEAIRRGKAQRAASGVVKNRTSSAPSASPDADATDSEESKKPKHAFFLFLEDARQSIKDELK